MSLGPYLTLVGLKHAGKSTIARTIADQCETAEAIDVDERMVADARREGWFPATASPGPPVRTLYRFLGADAFASWECETIRRITDLTGTTDRGANKPTLHRVISTGGGICDNPEALKILEGTRPIVYLWNLPENLFQRVIRDGVPPFLDASDPWGSFLALARKRDAIYRRIADKIVDISAASVEEAADIVLEAL